VAGRGGRPLLCTGADLRPPRLLLFSLHADPPLFSVSAVVRPPPAARAGGAGWWRRPEGAGGGDGGARSGSGGGDVGAGSGSGGGDVGAGSGGGDDRVGPSGRLEKKRERENGGSGAPSGWFAAAPGLRHGEVLLHFAWAAAAARASTGPSLSAF
jgi:hypothetical protein